MDALVSRVACLNNCAFAAFALRTSVRPRSCSRATALPFCIRAPRDLRASIGTTAYGGASSSSASFPNRLPLFSSSLSFRFPSTSPFLSAASLSAGVPASLDPSQANAEWGGFGCSQEGLPAGLDKRATVWTVVLLGWLGAEHRHLRRYADLYRACGIHAVTFVVPPLQVLSLDLGSRVERRIAGFIDELVSRVSGMEKDGANCSLLFHTFSNTGWLCYGVILDYLQSRPNMLDKIKGCIVDSGADPDINPRVWAAGFSAAFLKKQSSLTQPALAACNKNSDSPGSRFNIQDGQQSLLPETLVLAVLEKLFTFLLGTADVNRKLNKIISTLKENQPLCPQLYLYSTADKVMPVQSVERFIQEQRASGRTVYAHNFLSSPHVDHLRSFPEIYSAVVRKFLEECVLHTVVQT